MHPFLQPLICLALIACGQVAVAEELGASLDGLLAYAREHNPELAMRTGEAAAMHAGVGAASALPDPSFQLELMDFTNAATNGSPSLLPGGVGVTRYLISQPLPYFGKRDLRGQVARHQAEQGDAQRDATWLEVEGRIRAAYARYYQAVEQARILTETRELLGDTERLAVTRYGVGLAPQQDALRTQTEITNVRVELLDARQRQRTAMASLNTLLPREADAPLAAPRRLPLPAAVPALRSLRELVAGHAPEVARDRAVIDAARSSKALTLRDRYPDFELGLRDTRPREGVGSWDVMLTMTIPLQQTARRHREAEAGYRLEAAQATLAATRSRIEGQLGEAHAGLESSRDKADLLRGTLLPQAEATLQAARAGYENGKVDFSTLIEAQRQILRTRLSLLDAEVETALGVVEVERLTGAKL